jgi:putative tricarboxylic transport membrane protein
MIFGVLGYFMSRYGYPAAPAVLALVLGYMLESNFRYALLMHYGSFFGILTRPVTDLLLLMAAASFTLPFVMKRLKKTQA